MMMMMMMMMTVRNVCSCNCI